MKIFPIIGIVGGAALGIIAAIVVPKIKDKNRDTSGDIETANGSINNIGNIKVSSDVFKGEIKSPSAIFKSFDTPGYGYRAMIRILRTYYTVHHLKTLSQMIRRYAPGSEDNMSSYIAYVAKGAGISGSQDISNMIFTSKVKDIVKFMSIFEQGYDYKPKQADIDFGYNMA